MTKVICDLCGCTVNGDNDRVRLYIADANKVLGDDDFCIRCATRLINKLNNYIADERAKMDENKTEE